MLYWIVSVWIVVAVALAIAVVSMIIGTYAKYGSKLYKVSDILMDIVGGMLIACLFALVLIAILFVSSCL